MGNGYLLLGDTIEFILTNKEGLAENCYFCYGNIKGEQIRTSLCLNLKETKWKVLHIGQNA